LQALAPVGSCTPGEERLLTFRRGEKGAIPFGVAICFEDTDSALMRSYAAKGARFLSFITNDSWFSDSVEAEAHAWQASARAIETGLPIVRTGNSGVSGIIFPKGGANWLLGVDGRPLVDASGVMCSYIAVPSVPLDEGKNASSTVYVKFGDIPLAVIFALLITAMIMVKYGHEYKRIRSMPM
jgi:apolipoprotein N-acyltransferase